MAIVPKTQIGDLRVGTERAALPQGARVDEYGGELRGVRFGFGDDNRVEDIWIEDLRTFEDELSFEGRDVPKRASLAELQRFFGGCQEVGGIKGGRFFNCAAGVALGAPSDGSETFIQLRIKHR
jgi:hypothetical protein